MTKCPRANQRLPGKPQHKVAERASGRLKGVKKELVGLTNNWILTTSFFHDSSASIPFPESSQLHRPRFHLLSSTNDSGLAELSILNRPYPSLAIQAPKPATMVVHKKPSLARTIPSRHQQFLQLSLHQTRHNIRDKRHASPIVLEKPRRPKTRTDQPKPFIHHFYWPKELPGREIVRGFNNLIATNAKDALAEGDPNQGCGDRLFTGVAIGTSRRNPSRMGTACSQPLAKTLSKRQALCTESSFSLGLRIKTYWDFFCANNLAITRGQRTTLRPNRDQKIHNKIVYKDQPNERFASPTDGLISTLSDARLQRIAIDRYRPVAFDAMVPAGLHQADRHPGLVTHLQQAFQP